MISILRNLTPATPFFIGVGIASGPTPILLTYAVPKPLALTYSVPAAIQLAYAVPRTISMTYDPGDA